MKLDLSVSFSKRPHLPLFLSLPNKPPFHSFRSLFTFHNSSQIIKKNTQKVRILAAQTAIQTDRQMGSEAYVGFMAVVAVSSSVALVALQLHRRLASDYMKKIELILANAGSETKELKKKVRFAPDVIEPSSNNKEYRRRCLAAAGH